MTNFRITYDVVTHESAERGDYAESGFVHANGVQYELPADVWGDAAIPHLERANMQLRDAIKLIGCVENGGDGTSYYEADGRHNYSTGDETRYALHLPDNVTGASINRIARLLRNRNLLR